MFNHFQNRMQTVKMVKVLMTPVGTLPHQRTKRISKKFEKKDRYMKAREPPLVWQTKKKNWN